MADLENAGATVIKEKPVKNQINISYPGRWHQDLENRVSAQYRFEAELPDSDEDTLIVISPK